MTVIFTHIPKCAGSTIHCAVMERLDAEQIFMVRNGPPDVDVLAQQTKSFRYIGGHIRYSLARPLFPNATLIGSIREPAERLWSLYLHLIRLKQIPAPDGDAQTAFFDWVRKQPPNEQCSYFSKSSTCAEAIENITQDYEIVWHAPCAASAWPAIHELIFDAPDESLKPDDFRNVAPTGRNIRKGHKPRWDFLTPELRSLITQLNPQDVALHEWISGLGIVNNTGKSRF